MSDENLALTHVSRPPETETDGPNPAIVIVHGRGTDEEDLLPIAEQLPEELHVLSVRAPNSMQEVVSGQVQSNGFTWYELDLSEGGLHVSQPDEEDFRRSLDLLHEFVEEAIEAYNLDADRIGLLGFSQGAIMSLSSLLERPERYAWVVALNGYLAAIHDDAELLRGAAGKPIFLGIGEMDQVIPAERGQRAAETLLEAGHDVEVQRYPVGHGTTPPEIQDVALWVAERF